jgi:hypothetical protein
MQILNSIKTNFLIKKDIYKKLRMQIINDKKIEK